jgi:virginiamycin B lyase
LPASSQTHEVVAVTPGMLLVSQQPSGALVKVRLDPASGRPLESVAHVIDSPFSGLHGLTVSRHHPGKVWVTLQFSSQLLLIDPVSQDIDAPPLIERRIDLPQPARGPHVAVEQGNYLWVSCKDSHHILQIDAQSSTINRVIPCPPRPIFVQVHPLSGDLYATLDQSSALFCIPAASTGEPMLIPLDPQFGSTPVGMVPGPDCNLWFAMLGTSSGGKGSFGRIREDGGIDQFQLQTGVAGGAAFIHLGFPPDETKGSVMYLLASSMAAHTALNAVIELRMSPDYSRVEMQQSIVFPTQQSMSHRVLSTAQGLYATQLGSCTLVHLQSARSPLGETVNELADPYGLWGCGVTGSRVCYPGPEQ